MILPCAAFDIASGEPFVGFSFSVAYFAQVAIAQIERAGSIAQAIKNKDRTV
jgi:hypothetical protein